jgi:hypothetical protein
MTNSSAVVSSRRRTATWRRKGDEWILMAARRAYACIVQDNDHWICFALDTNGNHYDLGPSLDLARAKAFISERFGP